PRGLDRPIVVPPPAAPGDAGGGRGRPRAPRGARTGGGDRRRTRRAPAQRASASGGAVAAAAGAVPDLRRGAAGLGNGPTRPRGRLRRRERNGVWGADDRPGRAVRLPPELPADHVGRPRARSRGEREQAGVRGRGVLVRRSRSRRPAGRGASYAPLATFENERLTADGSRL